MDKLYSSIKNINYDDNLFKLYILKTIYSFDKSFSYEELLQNIQKDINILNKEKLLQKFISDFYKNEVIIIDKKKFRLSPDYQSLRKLNNLNV